LDAPEIRNILRVLIFEEEKNQIRIQSDLCMYSVYDMDPEKFKLLYDDDE